jgi:arabinan endo-1,5-alpha-L-arabinosidase
MATNTTLDFTTPGNTWVDQGMIIESENGAPYNAIDPGIFYDQSTNRMWLTFGSFWNGIYITELDPATGKRITPNSTTFNIARNPGSPVNAIEAPFLTKQGDFYYLFVNWDTCCQGVNSTYKIRVGRSTSPTGPFRDRMGLAMTSGGGELFLQTQGDFIGPGHFSDFSENGTNYFSYHYYDGADNGQSKLAIEEFAWTVDGWPVLVDDLPPGDFNHDGAVNAADYVFWRKTGGFPDDYTAWRTNFGTTLGPGSAATGGTPSGSSAPTVPEPCSYFLASIGLLGMIVGLRWR